MSLTITLAIVETKRVMTESTPAASVPRAITPRSATMVANPQGDAR